MVRYAGIICRALIVASGLLTLQQTPLLQGWHPQQFSKLIHSPAAEWLLESFHTQCDMPAPVVQRTFNNVVKSYLDIL
jgi:hypothetical protein